MAWRVGGVYLRHCLGIWVDNKISKRTVLSHTYRGISPNWARPPSFFWTRGVKVKSVGTVPITMTGRMQRNVKDVFLLAIMLACHGWPEPGSSPFLFVATFCQGTEKSGSQSLCCIPFDAWASWVFENRPVSKLAIY